MSQIVEGVVATYLKHETNSHIKSNTSRVKSSIHCELVTQPDLDIDHLIRDRSI